ncbi:MAG: hypothetical protein IJY08_04265 [Clostridia bacterium]|nr:hypothetical protein [Clostridia bacterium]
MNSTPSSHDEEPVSLPRSYGVRKRVTWVTRLNDIIASVLAVILIAFFALIFAAGCIWLNLMLGAMGVVLAGTCIVLLIYFIPCRKLRKRLKFIFRLKRRCKKLGYKLEFKRGLFHGLRFNTEGLDFTVDTRKKQWRVRFMTPRKYLSHIIFIDKNTIDIRTNITRSRLKFVLGLNSEKIRRTEYSFNDPLPTGYKKVSRALILNPVPHDAFKKDSDGAVIPIGTGEYLYGYTMFSGSGFLETLMREDE